MGDANFSNGFRLAAINATHLFARHPLFKGIYWHRANAESPLEKLIVMKTIWSIIAVGFALGFAAPSGAQVPPNCTVAQAAEPDRQVLKCAFGLTLELESAAQMEIFGEIMSSEPTDMVLDSGAALIEVEPGAARPQIRTPHAIAAVRGTLYVVDVSASMTSVFVLRGTVEVSQATDATEQVILGPGEGVDVTPDSDLQVKTWPEERVQALLARFGR